MKKQNRISLALTYIILIIVGFIMIYPLLWLFFSTFKTNNEIFSSTRLLPEKFILSGYIDGWKGSGQFTFGYFMLNTFKMVIPTVLVTIISSSIVAYGFARFDFPFKNFLITLMISTMMLPNAVLIIPRYLLFKNLSWLDSYKPFYMPQLFAFAGFFNFLMVQFYRGIPRELDESAYIDGYGSFRTLIHIIIPLCKPAIFSMGIFQFLWTWNDFFNPLIYINSVKKYPVSLALRMSIDSDASVPWNKVLAMSFISIVPLVILFFSAQKYFVEGVATTGLKG